MPDTMVKNTTGILRRILDNLGRKAWPLFLTGIFFRIIALTLLTPVVSGITTALISMSGRGTIVNDQIASFFTEPLGFITLTTIAAFSLTVFAIEQASLMVIIVQKELSGFNNAYHALRFVFARSIRILHLAGRIVLRVLLLSIPFLALSICIYFFMLSGHDINYYLTVKPPVFKWAVALIGLVGLGYSIALCHLTAGVIISLPILIFESESPAFSLRESRRRTTGHRKQFALGFFIWAIIFVSLSGITTALIVWIGRLLAPPLLDQTVLLMLFFGGIFLFSTLIHLLINMAATASFSLLIIEWYRPLSPLKRDLRTTTISEISNQKSTSPHFSRRLLITGTLATLILGLMTGWLLLSNADLQDRTAIVAHRGASAAAPENTLTAIVRAIADGAHWVEIDVQRTADDAVVVIHDRDLMKIGGKPLIVTESPLENLVAVDVGSWFDPKFANQRIPTLEEVLKRCKDKIKVNIELKYYGWDERLARRVVEIVEKTEMENHIEVMSLQPQAIRQVKEMRPNWQVGLLSAAALSDIVHDDADFLAVHSRMATLNFVKRVHDAGKLLYVWTVNDAVGMMQMFDLGVDALITDKPDMAIRLLDQRTRLEPAERMLLAAGFLLLGEPEHVNPATDGIQIQKQETDES